ncbi:hypothetical protein EAG18_07285 [Pseudoalteromonas sp. J010]|uniref:hypothetical protein n=1 Tax=Pseudoalteromonas sp. J010 TaxID=998465 RepID=UPI000F646F6C|nr:hypothetical protein [Pseudoalteromonas sp. J010]RRS09238.1 hypothetical protein EAG18_07285 [Pseudoalteromonas sp. J010]
MFTDKVALTLTLTVKQQTHTVAGGNIKFCQLNLGKQGFNGEVHFWLSDESDNDSLISDFTSEQLIDLTLGVTQDSSNPDKDTLTLKALVAERSVYEQTFRDVKGNKVLYRKYQCRFFDAAQFLWQQHFPCELYVGKSMKEVISAQTTDALNIQFGSQILEQVQPLICLSMGATDLCFYQFVLNYLKQQGVFWRYDYKKHSYTITDDKVRPADNLDLLPADKPRFKVHYPKVDIKSQNLLNANSAQAKIIPLSQNSLVQGIKNDRLMCSPFTDTENTQKKLQLRHSTPQMAKLQFTLRAIPVNQLYPGVGLELKHPGWSNISLAYQQPYQGVKTGIKLTATRQNAPDDLNMPATQYQCEYQGIFEHQQDNSSDGEAPLPEPCFVEGTILSEPGADEDKSYQYVQDESTKQNQYRVHIPLWDQEIKLLFRPDFLPPHFYFPLYKGCRVLLEISLFEAQICRVLDWGASVFLEQNTQGNHLLLGNNDKDQTAIKHEYQDDKPVFSIKRTKDKDTELMQWQDGKITIQTQEADGD